MSSGANYYTLPLSILHSGTSAMDALESSVSYGLVNAGIGYRMKHGEDDFQDLLEEAEEDAREKMQPVKAPNGIRPELWEAALAGAKLLGITGGSRSEDVKIYVSLHKPKVVFFKMRSDFLWNAIYTARSEAGKECSSAFKPLSWREFRILAAILSGKLNGLGFAFLGWESIQARACGYHTKELFKASQASLPPHCEPLGRDIIRRETQKLEGLGFFARCHYSTGGRGGLSAYSFRHAKREELIEAILQWRASNHHFKSKADANRAADHAAFKKAKWPPSHHQHK